MELIKIKQKNQVANNVKSGHIIIWKDKHHANIVLETLLSI